MCHTDVSFRRNDFDISTDDDEYTDPAEEGKLCTQYYTGRTLYTVIIIRSTRQELRASEQELIGKRVSTTYAS